MMVTQLDWQCEEDLKQIFQTFLQMLHEKNFDIDQLSIVIAGLNNHISNGPMEQDPKEMLSPIVIAMVSDPYPSIMTIYPRSQNT